MRPAAEVSLDGAVGETCDLLGESCPEDPRFACPPSVALLCSSLLSLGERQGYSLAALLGTEVPGQSELPLMDTEEEAASFSVF